MDGAVAVVHVADGGAESPPVLALHGLTAGAATWRGAARRLAPGVTLYAVDLPGRGRAPPPAVRRFDLDREVERTAALVERLELDRPLLLGHSQGAALAVGVAAAGRRRTAPGRRPCRRGGDAAGAAPGADRVGKPEPHGLVLLNPVTPWTRRPAALDLLAATLEPNPACRAVETLARHLVPRLRRPVTRWVLEHRVFTGASPVPGDAVARYAGPWADPARAASLPRILADWNPAALARYLPPPILPGRILAGARDRRIHAEDARRLAGVLGIPMRLLADAGHGLPDERPADVAAAVRAVLREAG